MMHVVFRDGLEDRDWLERHTVGHEDLRERAREWTPARTAETTGLRPEEIEAFAREYATTRPSAIRLNYGLNRHAGGGMAVRTVACLPGGGRGLARRRRRRAPLHLGHLPGGRRPPSSGPTSCPPGTRTLNMSQLGRILTDATLDPPVKALFVYNSNPAAVAPEQDAVRRGLAREDLFVVVHEQFQTDTADFADILLPATTTLEHYDIHKAYGHLYVSLSRPAIAPLGEALPNTELFRRLAARMGLDHPCLREIGRADGPAGLQVGPPVHEGDHLRAARARGLGAPARARPVRALRGGRLPDALGKVRAAVGEARRGGARPRGRLRPAARGAHERPRAREALPARLHLAARPPLPELHVLGPAGLPAARGRGERHDPPRTTPLRAGSRTVPWCASSTTAGRSSRGPACPTRRGRGVVVGLSIWWPKLCPGGRNANAVTSQALTDMGGGATFFDALVEVEGVRS